VIDDTAARTAMVNSSTSVGFRVASVECSGWETLRRARGSTTQASVWVSRRGLCRIRHALVADASGTPLTLAWTPSWRLRSWPHGICCAGSQEELLVDSRRNVCSIDQDWRPGSGTASSRDPGRLRPSKAPPLSVPLRVRLTMDDFGTCSALCSMRRKLMTVRRECRVDVTAHAVTRRPNACTWRRRRRSGRRRVSDGDLATSAPGG
jgi:hypothetical protein